MPFHQCDQRGHHGADSTFHIIDLGGIQTAILDLGTVGFTCPAHDRRRQRIKMTIEQEGWAHATRLQAGDDVVTLRCNLLFFDFGAATP